MHARATPVALVDVNGHDDPFKSEQIMVRDGDEEGKLERKRVVTKKAEARTRNKGFMKVRRGTCLALS